jgi:hypothetical protein
MVRRWRLSCSDALGKRMKLVATNATSVILPDTGHWILEESPQATTDALMRFLRAPPASVSSASALPEMRLKPEQVRANQSGSDQIGSSGLAGVSTKVLFGP